MRPFSITALNYYVNKCGDVKNSFFDPKGLSSLASARLQMFPCLNAVKQLGGNLNILSFHSSQPELLNTLRPTDACVVGKLTANSQALIDDMAMANLAAITRLKNTKAKIVVLYSDHHLSRPNHDPLHKLYRDLFYLADHIIYPSQTLLNLSKMYTDSITTHHVIEDPWQISKQYSTRTLSSDDTCKVIWFGGGSNLVYLRDQLKQIISTQNTDELYELTVLTTDHAIKELKNLIPSLNIIAPNWIMRFVTWSNSQQPIQLENELLRAHISIIPSDPNDPLKMGVSHNRVVDAARAGCLVLASPMKSYLQLQDVCLIGQDIGSLLKHARQNYEQIATEKNDNCSTSLQKFSPSANIKSWEKIWLKIISNSSL